jgi:cyclopropane fatty-acyl-phospholipid synthase-like methyltransferase
MATYAGMRVVGVDGSAGMLEQARGRGVAERLDHVRLQDLAFDREFDGSITVDAMENVPLEDWPVVLRNLRHAVRPGGLLYLTVEEIDGAEIDAAYRELTARGLPAVQGELMEGDVAGYHYYPPRAQVLDWFASAGFSVMDEGSSQEDQGWGYRHFLLRA